MAAGGPGAIGSFIASESSNATPTTDGSPTAEPTADETPTETPTTTTEEFSPTVRYRLNAGGPRLSATDDGPDWLADTSARPSTYLNHQESSTAVSNTSDQIQLERTVPQTIPRTMFKTYRFHNPSVFNTGEEMEYEFPVDPGHRYEVRLYVMEPYFVAGQTAKPSERPYSDGGPRTFGVSINGNIVLQEYEPFAEHGHDVGAVKSIPVSSNDGRLTIRFLTEQENPVISGIEIIDNGPVNES